MDATKAVTLPSRWLEVLTKVKRVFPEAVIGGGALRDLYNDRPVKDVDIWITSRGPITQGWLEVALGCEVTPLHEEIAKYETVVTDLACVYNVNYPTVGSYGLFDDTTAEDAKIQIIALTFPVTMESAVARFDFGLCRIATDGKDWLITPEFLADVANKRFTLLVAKDDAAFDASVARFERLRCKYDGWTMEDWTPA